MTRSDPGTLHSFDPEIDSTFHTLQEFIGLVVAFIELIELLLELGLNLTLHLILLTLLILLSLLLLVLLCLILSLLILLWLTITIGPLRNWLHLM